MLRAQNKQERIKPIPQSNNHTKPGKQQARVNLCFKQNINHHQNTPKLPTDSFLDDVEQLSQIKFISKQCSLSRQQGDNSSNGRQKSDKSSQLEFSPLFQDNLMLEIVGIEEDLWTTSGADKAQFRTDDMMKKNAKNQMIKSDRQIRTDRSHQSATSQPGKIKRNLNPSHTQIPLIFTSLDKNSTGLLTKSNCATQHLNTQLNYLIGSMLNKIKKGKEYGLREFGDQFMRLVEGSPRQELEQVLMSNRQKRQREDLNRQDKQRNMYKKTDSRIKQVKLQINKPEQSNIVKKKQQFRPVNQQQLTQKIHKLNDRLNLYILKNDLLDSLARPTPIILHTIQEQQDDTLQSIRASTIHKNTLTSIQSDRSNDNIVQMKASKASTQRTSIYHNISSEGMIASLRNDLSIIRGLDGSCFELSFQQLNKHID